MNSAIVNSIMARCLLEPVFLREMARDRSAALDRYPLDERTHSDFLKLDVDRLRSFAGFITKVQHNYLWETFPCTRALLIAYGIEIEMFASYRDTQQWILAQGQRTQTEKTEQLVKFLKAYLESRKVQCPGLLDVLAHEQIIWELEICILEKPRSDSEVNASSLRSQRFEKLVPAIRGTLKTHDFVHDPLKIASGLAIGNFKLHQIAKSRRRLSYWADVQVGQVRIVELDPLALILLSEVNGKRSIRTIIRRASAKMELGLRPSHLKSFFESALQQGLLTLSR